MLAGSALMGTVLVSIVLAQSDLSAQAARAEKRIEACRQAEQFLAHWWPKRGELPRSGSGEIEDHPGWSWRTETIVTEQTDELNAEIVTLEIFPTADGPGSPSARVQILLPEGTHATPEGTDTD